MSVSGIFTRMCQLNPETDKPFIYFEAAHYDDREVDGILDEKLLSVTGIKVVSRYKI